MMSPEVATDSEEVLLISTLGVGVGVKVRVLVEVKVLVKVAEKVGV